MLQKTVSRRAKNRRLLIQAPHGRCLVSDLEKAELVRQVVDEAAKHQHLWYIGFGNAHSQYKELKCFESTLADHLLFPCVEILQYAIKNGYASIFVVRTNLHGLPFNQEAEATLVHDAVTCCRYGGMILTDYIILKTNGHLKHRLRQLAVSQWES